MNVKLKKFNVLAPSVLAKEQIYVDMSQPIREKKGTPPLEFKTVSEELIDWYIKGAEGGVGRISKNKLRQVEQTISDGGYGIRIYASSYLSSRTVTFNSGAATGINFVFKNSDDSNISPTDVGTITISAADQPDIVISNIYQGGISTEDVGSADGHYCVGYGDDSSGRTIIYNNDNTQYIPMRCKTLPFVISENTDYTITRTGGSEDINFAYTLTKDMGEISLIWGSPNVNSIPGNETASRNTEQWTVVETEYERITQFGANIQIDSHPATFGNCAYYADLTAGHWKVIAECINNDFTNSAIVDDTTPYMALIAEDGTEIISKTNLFQTRSAYFGHEEYDFTLSDDTKVGLYFKSLHRDGYPAYVRFMIVDYDVQAEPFESDILSGGTVSGVTCWEPYQCELPIIIMNHDHSQVRQVVIDLGSAPLGPNDIVSYSSTNIPLPTFIGENNTITVDTPIRPSEIYIKYRRFFT